MTNSARISQIRDLLPTTLGSAEIRDQIAADVRARSVFVSRAANVVFLSKVKEVVDLVTAGKMDKATAQVILLETLRAVGYTPEDGFPDDISGDVPEAAAGTLQDLTSFRRLSLIIDTQRALMNGAGQQIRGMEPERMAQFPAWELVRVGTRRAPRNWGDTQQGSPPRHNGQPDLRSRWTIAGGSFTGGRLIALKGDPVWGELGASENFDDALDTDHPPFAFNSGMGWQEVDRAECEQLGITGPDGETIEQWLGKEHPILTPLQPPVISVASADPRLVLTMTRDGVGGPKDSPAPQDESAAPKDAIAVQVGDRITPNNPDAIQRLRDRMAAIAARRKELRS